MELPHTWNAKDGQDGGNDYWRGCCTYCTRFAAPAYDPAQQQVWLQFEGVNACRRDAVAKGMKLEEAMDKWQTLDQLPAEYRS